MSKLKGLLLCSALVAFAALNGCSPVHAAIWQKINAETTTPSKWNKLCVASGPANTWHKAGTCAVAGYTVNITANTSDYNLKTAVMALGWNGTTATNVTVTISSGVYVYATSTANAGFDTGSGWPSGSTITLVNNGYIIGKGGNGQTDSYDCASLPAISATAGGPALKAQYAISVTNNTYIAGGGGGGSGAGGGGGAGGGNGGGALCNLSDGQGSGGSGGAPGQVGSSGTQRPMYYDACYSWVAGGGGGGGRILPGTGGASAYYYGAGGSAGGGGSGGGADICNSWGQWLGGAGGSSASSGSSAGDVWLGAGGGGWGAAGGNGYSSWTGQTTYGGAGGPAVQGNAYITWTATGTRWGALQ